MRETVIMSVPKFQHYVPRFYLGRFLDRDRGIESVANFATGICPIGIVLYITMSVNKERP